MLMKLLKYIAKGDWMQCEWHYSYVTVESKKSKVWGWAFWTGVFNVTVKKRWWWPSSYNILSPKTSTICRINDSKPSLYHHLPAKCFCFSNRALTCSAFALSHGTAGKKPHHPKQQNKTRKRQMEPLLHPSMVGKVSHCHWTLHRSQQGCARVGSREHTPAPPVQPPAEPNRQKWSKNAWIWSALIFSTTARTKIKACEGW